MNMIFSFDSWIAYTQIFTLFLDSLISTAYFLIKSLLVEGCLRLCNFARFRLLMMYKLRGLDWLLLFSCRNI